MVTLVFLRAHTLGWEFLCFWAGYPLNQLLHLQHLENISIAGRWFSAVEKPVCKQQSSNDILNISDIFKCTVMIEQHACLAVFTK